MINKNHIVLIALVVGAYFILKARKKEIYAEPSTMTDVQLFQEFQKTYWAIRGGTKQLSPIEKKRWDGIIAEVNKRGKMADFLSKSAGKS